MGLDIRISRAKPIYCPHCGEWARVDDQIKKWTDIKNKFEKGA